MKSFYSWGLLSRRWLLHFKLDICRMTVAQISAKIIYLVISWSRSSSLKITLGFQKDPTAKIVTLGLTLSTFLRYQVTTLEQPSPLITAAVTSLLLHDSTLLHLYSWQFCNTVTYLEFFLKIICHYSKRARTCHPATSCVRDQASTTVPARHMWERQDLRIDCNSCFSDSSDSLNSLNSVKLLLHLGKTPLCPIYYILQSSTDDLSLSIQ